MFEFIIKEFLKGFLITLGIIFAFIISSLIITFFIKKDKDLKKIEKIVKELKDIEKKAKDDIKSFYNFLPEDIKRKFH